MLYTIKQFQKDFPNDDTCLEYIFRGRYGNNPQCPKCNKRGFYRIKKRKCYACSHCGYQIHPAAGTIFHKSSTKLTDWFFAIYLMSKAKNGVSAKELQKHLGTTYKTAWRIGSQIRSLMKQSDEMLSGVVEADETFIGGRRRSSCRYKNKIPVMGMVERGGRIRAKKIDNVQTHTLLGELQRNVKFGSHLMTDDYSVYKKAPRLGFSHQSINHTKKKYVEGDVYTNTIEGFWSQMKRSIGGTYHSVSPKHLQSYVDEFVFYYNARLSSASSFLLLLSYVCGQRGQEGDKSLSLLEIPVFS